MIVKATILLKYTRRSDKMSFDGKHCEKKSANGGEEVILAAKQRQAAIIVQGA